MVLINQLTSLGGTTWKKKHGFWVNNHQRVSPGFSFPSDFPIHSPWFQASGEQASVVIKFTQMGFFSKAWHVEHSEARVLGGRGQAARSSAAGRLGFCCGMASHFCCENWEKNQVSRMSWDEFVHDFGHIPYVYWFYYDVFLDVMDRMIWFQQAWRLLIFNQTFFGIWLDPSSCRALRCLGVNGKMLGRSLDEKSQGCPIHCYGYIFFFREKNIL